MTGGFQFLLLGGEPLFQSCPRLFFGGELELEFIGGDFAGLTGQQITLKFIGGEQCGNAAQFGFSFRSKSETFHGFPQFGTEFFQLGPAVVQIEEQLLGGGFIQTHAGSAGMCRHHAGHHRQHGGYQEVADDDQYGAIHLC